MIIFLGFPKCGNSSFQYLLAKLGYDVYCYQLPEKNWFDFLVSNKNRYIGCLMDICKRRKIKLFSFIKNCNEKTCVIHMEICQSKTRNFWPQITDYKQIYEENMDATFILNKRDPAKILKSMKNYRNLYNRIIEYNSDLLKDMDGINNDEKILNLIKTHHNNMNTFFKSKQNVKYIEYDIDLDKITKLKNYINLKNVNELPHKNITPDNK